MEGSANDTTPGLFSFAVGELVKHRDKDFRGVVVDAHPHFQGPTDEGEAGAETRRRWQQPWYELLVHGTPHVVYLPQEAMERDPGSGPISHPLLRLFFNRFDGARYSLDGVMH